MDMAISLVDKNFCTIWRDLEMITPRLITINCKKLSSLKLVFYGQPSLKNSKNQGILSSP
jgi:hypothetical protein